MWSRSFRSILCRIALAVCSGVAPAGCGPARQPAPDAPVVIRVLLPASERGSWASVVHSFTRSHPGVRVELIEGPESTDLREDLYTASLLARDPTFDLVYMDVTWTAKFASAGWLLPLDRAFPARDRAALLPAAVEAGRYAGHLYRIPVRTDVGVLYYRSDLLEAAGLDPPRTPADLIEVAKRLQSPPGRWGFVWQGRQYEGLVCDYLELLHGYGGFWVDPATREVGLDRPEAERALAFLVECIGEAGISPAGVTTYQEEESRRLFQDGRAVFLRNWPYVWSLAQGEDSEVRGRVGVRSMVSEPGQPAGVALGGWGLGVSAHSEHPELATEFVRAVISRDGQRLLCASTGFAPARIEAYADSALLAANPFLSQILRLHEHAVARPAIARYAVASDILQRHLSAALIQRERVDEALSAAAIETRHAIGARRPAP